MQKFFFTDLPTLFLSGNKQYFFLGLTSKTAFDHLPFTKQPFWVLILKSWC